jgi:polyhydroxyalkanoate synthesis regulator phasin
MAGREDIRAMQDAWRAYLDLALGFTETSRKKATKVARKLVGRGNATAEQLQAMAEDLVTTSAANREALSRLVRVELERALSRVGLATAEEVSALTNRVQELEQQLEDARDGKAAATPPAALTPVAPPETAPETTPAAPVAAKKTVAKKTVAKKAAAPAPPAPEASVVAAAPTPPVARQAVAKKAPARTAVPLAKKAPVKRAPAKKAGAAGGPA